MFETKSMKRNKPTTASLEAVSVVLEVLDVGPKRQKPTA